MFPEMQRIPISVFEKEKVYTREELYNLAAKYQAKVLASQIIKTDRYKIIDAINGGFDLVLWQGRSNDFGIGNLIIAESVPADGQR